MAWWVLILLGLSVNTWVSAELFAPCPAECSCLPADRHVICTNANLTSIPPIMANSTVELHMDHNNLTFLRQSFHQDLPDMRSFYLRSCNIQSIKSDAFQKVTGIQHLFLDGNEIQEIENGTFDPLSNLLYLYLSKNKISSLQPGIFSPLKNLIALYLRYNQLTEISDGSLKGLTQLRWLDLGYNMISNISKQPFDDSTSLRKLELEYNFLTRVPSLKSKVNLQTLRLSGNTITKLSTISFGRNYKSLSELYLDNVGLKKATSLAFSRLRRLEVLDLRNNSLTSLSMSRIKMSTKVYLSGNPWKCDCSIAEVYVRILMANKRDPEQEVQCKSPKDFEGRSLTTINILNLSCKSFAVDATTISPTKQTKEKMIKTSPPMVTTSKAAITYKTTTQMSTTWMNTIEEDPCFADDISNILVTPAGEDSLIVSWSSSRDYRYFQVDYSSGDHKETLRILGVETHVQLLYLFPGTIYSICIIPQNKDITTCTSPNPKQCASGQTNGLPETAYHIHSPPKATTTPFVIVGSAVVGVVILAAVVISVYIMRSRNFRFQRYHNEDEMEDNEEGADPYKWDNTYENVDDDRHVYVTSSSLWGMDNDKLDCSLAEPIPLPSVPQYVSL